MTVLNHTKVNLDTDLNRAYNSSNPQVGISRAVLYASAVFFVALFSSLCPTESEAQSALPGSMLYEGVQSPTAASLGSFGDTPVGLYTGTPNIEIPLVETDEGDFSVTLNYNASGVRVSQAGGWVGIGWALQAGGAITRTVRGLPDDNRNGYYYTGSSTQRVWDNLTTPLPGNSLPQELAPEIMSIVGREADGEPDTFYFNVGGRSGKFVIGPNREINTVPTSNVTFEVEEGTPMNRYGDTCGIKAPSDGFTKWIMTDERGVRYIFGEVELAQQTSTSSGDSPVIVGSSDSRFVSSWYLSRIEFPGSDEHIDFEYDVQGGIQHAVTEYQETYSMSFGSDCPLRGGVSYSHQYHQSCPPVLKEIRTRSKKISFDVSPRSDVDGWADGQAYKLDKMKLWDLGDTEGEAVRSFSFDYSYYSNRLFLTGLQIQGTNTENGGEYLFDYNNPESLPGDRSSTSIDHWGYHNGAPNRSGLISGINADRTPNGEYTTDGVLTQINYPTGGSTHFEYEPNTYSTIGHPDEEVGNTEGGGIRIKEITDYDNLSDNNGVAREYIYSSPHNEGVSSGVLVNKPQYSIEAPDPGPACSHTKRYSVSRPGLGTTQGSPVGYSDVQVVQDDGSVAHHTFSDPADVPDYTMDGFDMPHAPLSSRDWQRGRKESTEYMSENLNTVKIEENAYSIGEHGSQVGSFSESVPAISYQRLLAPEDDPYTDYAYTYKYEITTGWVNLEHESITYYSDGEEVAATRSHEYETTAPNVVQLRRTTEQTTSGRARTKTYRYAHEEYPEMGHVHGTNQLSGIYRETVRNLSDEILRDSWTTWQPNIWQSADIPGWVPYQRWVQTSASSSEE